MTISNYNRAWLMLVSLVPSILVAIFDLYHFLRSRTLRTALSNHVIILLLLCVLIDNLTDVIWQIYYYFHGQVLSFTPVFCSAWIVIGPSMYISSFTLMAWASIERHILIFHPALFATRVKRMFFHYLPMVLCIMWPITFYFVFGSIIPCDVPIRYNLRYCSRYNCILNKPWASLVDSIVNYIVPAFLTVLFSVTLFVRVLHYRYNVRRSIQWRNYKKLTFQLLPLSLLYLILQFPPMTLYAAYSAGLPGTIGAGYYSDGLFLTYWIVLLIPFACAVSLPNLRKKCKNVVLFWRRSRLVGALSVPLSRPKLGPMYITNGAV